MAPGLNIPPCMLMLPLPNAPTSMPKCIVLCMVMPWATNSLLTNTWKGGCVRVCSSLDLNLGKSVGLFSLYTCVNVQIHTDTPVAGTMLPRYLKIRPGFKERQALKELKIIALRLILMDPFFGWHFLSDANAVILLPSFHPSPSFFSRWLQTQRGPRSLTETHSVAFG